MLADLTLKQFLETLGSKAPTPGGGSAAALSGAMAFALVEMVARLTVGKKGYEAVNDEMQSVVAEAVKLRNELLADVDRDSAAFTQVTAAFKLLKESADDKVKRSAAIQDAYKVAALTPLAVAKRIADGLPLIRTVVERGNRNATSDGLCALTQAWAAMRGAIANVTINLGSIQDEAFVAKTRVEIAGLELACGQPA